MWTAWDTLIPFSLREGPARLSKTQPSIMGPILKILAINHTEEQHFLSNTLGFSFSTLQVEPTLMNVRGLVFFKKNTLFVS